MSSNKIEEDHHHLTFFTSHMFPQEESNITHMTPQQQAGNEKKSRRSRRVRKVSEEGNNEDAAMRKRKLSEEQVSLLESSFEHDHKLESERKERLASESGLDPRQVAVWFQNRRARWKSKKLEEEYSKLKSLHDIVLLQKYELQSQVLRMKEQLSEAEGEIRRLLERVGSSQSPSSSSFSMDAMGIPPFMVMEGYEYETERLQNVLYISDNLWGQSM